MNSAATKTGLATVGAVVLAVASFGRRRVYSLLKPVVVTAVGRRRFAH